MKLDDIINAENKPAYHIFPRIQCKDGTSLSVQVGRAHYCAPRSDHGPWVAVEMGFPSVAPTGELAGYAESPDELTDTVYGYVPVQLIRAFIDEHGGEV